MTKLIQNNNQNSEPLVSVIIPTYNSEKTLARCLESVKNQTYENIETIVVDKYSTDKTLGIASSYPARISQLKARERCEQINSGVRKAQGKYVYRVDSDFIVEPNVIEQAVNACEVNGFDAICVHNTSDPTVSFWSKVRKFERDMYRNDDLNSAARFVRKEAFVKIGGFDEELVAGEDYDFHNRLVSNGFKIGRIEAQEIHLGEPKTLKDVVLKHYYYGKTLRLFVRKNPEKGKAQLSPIRLAFIRNTTDFVDNPALAVGFFIFQFVRYVSAALGCLA